MLPTSPWFGQIATRAVSEDTATSAWALGTLQNRVATGWSAEADSDSANAPPPSVIEAATIGRNRFIVESPLVGALAGRAHLL